MRSLDNHLRSWSCLIQGPTVARVYVATTDQTDLSGLCCHLKLWWCSGLACSLRPCLGPWSCCSQGLGQCVILICLTTKLEIMLVHLENITRKGCKTNHQRKILLQERKSGWVPPFKFHQHTQSSTRLISFLVKGEEGVERTNHGRLPVRATF